MNVFIVKDVGLGLLNMIKYIVGYEAFGELYFATLEATNIKDLIDYCFYNIYGEVVLIKKKNEVFQC